jgi:hypothetical protein
MVNGQVSSEEAEKLRQEGREEVLDWLVAKELLGYSRPENLYFRWDWYKEILTQMPWSKSDKNQTDKIYLS